MNTLIIRTFEKDDWLARLCLESWIEAGYEGEVHIYSEIYESKYLIGNKTYHDPVDNFMGQIGVRSMLELFRMFPINDTDKIIQCDADIVIKSNPLTKEVRDSDIAGVGGMHAGYFHYNGECIIMSGRLVNEMLKITDAEFTKLIWDEMIGKVKSEVSDGHYFSYIAHKIKMKLAKCNNNWVHHKFYQHNGRTDFKNVIEEIKIQYPNER